MGCHDCDEMPCVEAPAYCDVNVTAGEAVELLCNTSLSADIMWTYDTNDGYVDYVYWNGRVASEKTQLSVKSTAAGSHSLVIAATELEDSGLYDCYDGEGLRKVGYQLLVIAGMRSTLCLTKSPFCFRSYLYINQFYKFW